MSNSARPYKRRKVYIKKEFQSRFIARFCFLVLAGGTLSTGLILYFSKDTLTSLFQHSRLAITSTALSILPAVIYTNLITVVLIALAIIIMTLFVSHKIAGPLYHFEKEIKTISNGDLTIKIYLRNKDQLRALAESINNMTLNLNQKVRDIQSELERIIESALGNDAPEWFVEKLQHLHQQVSQSFKL